MISLLVVLAATANIGVAWGQQTDPQPLPSDQSALPVLAQYGTAPSQAAGLAILDRALALLPQPTAFRGQVVCTRAALLDAMERPTESRAGYDQCRQLRPDDPNVLIPIALDESTHQRPVEAARLLMHAAAQHASGLDAVDPGTMGTIDRRLRYIDQGSVANDLIAGLVAAGYPRNDPSTLSRYTTIAIVNRLRAADTAGATQLLPTILSPSDGIAMLIDRKFAPIWPAIEQWAGSDLSVQRRALLSATRAAFEISNTDEARLRFADALVETGHDREAIDLIEEWLLTPATPDTAWDRNMAIMHQGRWLAEQGKHAEAIKRMRAALNVPAPLAVGSENITPNLVRHLLFVRDYAGAIDVLDHHMPTSDHVESPATMGYFVALRACALEGLGKHAKAVAEHQRLDALYRGNLGAQNLAVACLGSVEEQAHWWLKRVQQQDHTETLVSLAAARYAKANHLPPVSLEDDMLRRIENRPDIRRVYLELGRDLPERYAPGLDDFRAAPLPPRRTPAPVSAT